MGEFGKEDDFLGRIRRDIEMLGVVGDRNLDTALTAYIVGTSRLLEEPLGCLVWGPPSTGKSSLLRLIGDLFPKEHIFKFTSVTAQAFYYDTAHSYQHRFVICGEKEKDHQGSVKPSKALREFLEDGYLVKLSTRQMPNGKHVAQTMVTKGPIAYADSTTSSKIPGEDSSRVILLPTDPSDDCTRAVQRMVQLQAAGMGATKEEREQVVALHRGHQVELYDLVINNKRQIRVPYAEELTLPTSRPTFRRSFKQFCHLIQAIALLRAKQKPEDGPLDADAVDYEWAVRLFLPCLISDEALLTDQTERRMVKIDEQFGENEFTAQNVFWLWRECGLWDGEDPSSVRRHLNMLSSKETDPLVVEVEGTRPKRYKRSRAEMSTKVTPEDFGLPTVAHIERCCHAGCEERDTEVRIGHSETVASGVDG